MNNLANIRQPGTNSPNGSEQVLNIVINSLIHIFPAHTMKTQDAVNSVKREWLQAFIDNNIKTSLQIDRGLKAARRIDSPFFPSCGQFIAMCKPSSASHNEWKGLTHEREVTPPSKFKGMLQANQECKSLIHSFGLITPQPVEVK